MQLLNRTISGDSRSVSLALLALAFFTTQGIAAPVFFGPTPYLSAADIPAGFYAAGTEPSIEDFEDLSLDFGITANAGAPFGPASNADSVDADDGVIDGSGTMGRSFFSGNGPGGVTFTFAQPVTAAGGVWTDAGAGALVTFEAFGPGMVSLGTLSGYMADGSNAGETAEDRFYGVQDLDGIIAIKFSNTTGGIEVDHIQFGMAIPIPAVAYLFPAGLLAGLGWMRRRTR